VGDVTEPTVAVVAQGAKETALNGRTYAYSAGQFVITSLELPVAGHIVLASTDEPFLAFVLKLRADKIAALLLETAPAATGPSTAADAMSTGIAVSDASPALLDAIGRLLALVDTPRDAAALADGVEREVLWRLITGPQGGRCDKSAWPTAGSLFWAAPSVGSAGITTRRCGSRSSRHSRR